MNIINLLSLLIFISFSPYILAQDEMSTTEIIERMKEVHTTSYQKTLQLNLYKSYDDKLKEIEEGIIRDQEKEKFFTKELLILEQSEKNFDQSLAELKTYANDAIKNLSFLQSIGSRKKSFYNCLAQNIEKDGYPYINECQKDHPAKFSNEEKMRIKNFSLLLPHPKDKLSEEIVRIKKELEFFTEERTNSYTINYERVKALRDEAKNELIAREQKIDAVDRYKAQESFSHCGPSMKEIDLEKEYIYEGSDKKGPLYGVYRDNQDGIGTCYANTAKNLLAGLSGGEMVASFMDIALQFKKENGQLRQGLDAGGACTSLLNIKKYGFCDQKYAPQETGDKNEFLEGLLGGKYASVYTQGKFISKISDFLSAKKGLEAIDPKFSDYFLKNPKEIIKKLKNDPDILLPLPIVNITPTQNWQTKQAFYVANKNPSKEKLAEYTRDVNELDKKFRPKMIQMVLDDESYEKIAEAYSKPFKELLEKYGMLDSYDQIMKFHKNDFMSVYNEVNKRKLFKTVRFLQSITNSDNLPTQSFVASCINAFDKGFSFLEKLNPLVKEIEAINASAEVLLEGENFREAADLMQLAIAPTCLNEKNRTPIDFDIDCGKSYQKMVEMKVAFEGKNLIKAYRIRVVDNLLRGLPVGREHSTVGDESRSDHVHTIVGIRYNPHLDRCEYKIRESQNGRSEWHGEKAIAETTIGFVEVSRL